MKEQDPGNLARRFEFESGGTLTIKYGKDDVVSNAIGHVLAIPLRLLIGTPGEIFKNPPKELMDKLYERYKDVPWKGDLLVRIGYSSIIEDYKRLFGKDIKGRPNVFFRILSAPWLWKRSLSNRFQKGDHYNILTNTVTVYHPRLPVGMHEMGHAEFFDQSSHRDVWTGVGMLSSLVDAYILRNPKSANERGMKKILGALPGFTVYPEWKASQNAMTHFESKEEQQEGMKLLEPSFGTHVGHDVGSVVDIFGAEHDKTFDRILSRYNLASIGALIGALIGHATSRIPKDRTSSFGVIFEQEKTPQTEQVLYGSSQSQTLH